MAAAEGPVPASGPPRLVLGPQLRHVGETTATVWVETNRACEVEVLGRREGTFEVAGHHYAIVCLHELRAGVRAALRGAPRRRASPGPSPGSAVPAEPDPDASARHAPAARLRLLPRLAPARPAVRCARTTTRAGARSTRCWPSCSGCAPGARGMARTPLLLLGDQVYADEVSPDARARIARRGAGNGGRRPARSADFEEYTWLYHERWGDPAIRWLLSTVPSAMIFDDHDVHDDWNISRGLGAADPREALVGGARPRRLHVVLDLPASRQPLPRRAARRPSCWPRSRRPDGDVRRARARLRAPGARRRSPARAGATAATSGARACSCSTRAPGASWTRTRARCSPTAEWEWVAEQSTGDFDHLLIATSLPVLLAAGLHHLEAWNEAVCARRLGATGRAPWASACARRSTSSTGRPSAAASSAWSGCCAEVGSGSAGRRPASIVLLSGDVHHAYLAEAGFPRQAPGHQRRGPGGLLAAPQPARLARAPHAARGPLAAGRARGPRARARGRRSRARRCAGASPRTRRSTTRSRRC